jgi:iron complex transport system substrate-binding protein
MAALARRENGSCYDFPERETIETIWFGGRRDISREQMLSVAPDFLIGWDSTFGEDYFNKDFCQENGIAMYTPYCTTDFATFEDIYRDYETLGRIFDVEDVAAKKVAAMKETLARVKETLGDEAYASPVTIFNYDSGKDDAFTACRGLPGDIFKLAGGISIFDDIDKGWATVSWEQIVERDPQVIIVNEYTVGEAQEKIDFMYNHAALANVSAVVNKRVYAVHLDSMQGSCGSADAAAAIAAMLYPDLF